MKQIVGEWRKFLSEKINQGDVVEGIFAIAVALNLAYDQVDPNAVEALRKKIEPALYRKQRQVMVIADLSDVKTKDRIKVVLEIRLKSEKTVGGAFGAEYDTINDIPGIAKKQAALIAQIGNSSALRKIRKFKEQILNNGRRDAVIFTVIADGLEGETSGGSLKGDVKLRVQASESAKGDLADIVGSDIQEISFSLKSGSPTVANLSVYKGLISLGEFWGISGFSQNIQKYANIINRKTDQVEKAQLIAAMFTDFAEELDAMDKTPEFSKKVFDFLGRAIFGDDLADVVDITKSGIREVTKENFDAMIKQGMTFDVVIGKQSNGNPIIHFYKNGSTDPADKLFHLRTKIRIDADGRLKEAKLYPELGKLAYSTNK